MANIDVSVETDDKPAPPPDHPNTCPNCHSHYRDDELERADWVCAQCGHHFPMRARARIASLGDVTIAEPGALIAFTGPRVVQQTTREKLPEDFGLAEQNLRFGHLDAIVPRPEQREYLTRVLRLFA